jgi:hypothetical protein
MSQHHIVVSAENNCYMAWQCRLFHYSCMTHLGVRPVFIVHDLDRDWHPYFIDIVGAGGIVRRAPTYRRMTNGNDYSPRNTAGSLLQASQIGYPRNDFIVLCDADMIFLGKIVFPQACAAEGCSNLDYSDRRVRAAATKFGINVQLLTIRKNNIECAVPHVVPVSNAQRIAETWLEAIDSFQSVVWQASMYAFGFAVLKLKLKLSLTRFVALNDEPLEKIGRAKIIHYAYGDKIWNKRDYWYAKNSSKVWKPTIEAPDGTVLGEILSQILAADAFYSNASRYHPK